MISLSTRRAGAAVNGTVLYRTRFMKQPIVEINRWFSDRNDQKDDEPQRQSTGVFDSLKKQFEEEIAQNEKLKQQLNDLKKSTFTSKTINAAQKVESFAKDSTEKVKENVSKMSDSTEKIKEQVKESTSTFTGFFGGVKERLSEVAKENESEGGIVKNVKETTETVQTGLGKIKQILRIQELKQGFQEAVEGLKTSQVDKKKAKNTKESQETSEAVSEQNVLWAEAIDPDTGKTYYYHIETKETSWEIPPGYQPQKTTAVVVVQEEKTNWQKFSERLQSTPVIQSMMNLVNKVKYSTIGKTVQSTTHRVIDMKDDIQERWETSQNPWVYRAQGVIDSVFAETEIGSAIRDMKERDPDFDLETFLYTMEHEDLPIILKAFLECDMETLNKFCTDQALAVARVTINEYKSSGKVPDPTILELQNFELIGARPMEKTPPIFVFTITAQQINCVRDLEGNVVEGSEDDIRSVYYVFALKREWNENELEFQTKVIEMGISGVHGYL